MINVCFFGFGFLFGALAAIACLCSDEGADEHARE